MKIPIFINANKEVELKQRFVSATKYYQVLDLGHFTDHKSLQVTIVRFLSSCSRYRSQA